MLIHRVKVQECASAAITEVEYKHCLNRIREYVGPLSESASYQMLCSFSKPPAMIQKQETFERKMRRNLFGSTRKDLILLSTPVHRSAVFADAVLSSCICKRSKGNLKSEALVPKR